MSTSALIIIAGIVFLVSVVALGIVLGVIPSFSTRSEQVRGIKRMVQAQRATSVGEMPAGVDGEGPQRSTTQRLKDQIFDIAQEARTKRSGAGVNSISRKLRSAGWPIPVLAFHAAEIVLGLILFIIGTRYFSIVPQIFLFFCGPMFVRFLLNSTIERKFKKFDADYPAFLSSMTSLLKTGMNPMTALESAAQALDDDSMVRSEVELMLERVRVGVPEDKSIGSFAEDLAHPEVELFVQALLLSRRVGGTLSDTLERLAKQVRRRQYFRGSAVAAVGLQKGSIYLIIVILGGLFGYLWIIFPEVIHALSKDMGWVITQHCVLVILIGILWVRTVTKIKL